MRLYPLLLVLLLFISCSHERRIQMVNEIDLNAISTNKEIYFEIPVSNHSNDQYKIIEIRPSCNCTVIENQDRILKPQSQVSIPITMIKTTAGTVHERILVTLLNLSTKQSVERHAHIYGVAEAPFYFEPDSIREVVENQSDLNYQFSLHSKDNEPYGIKSATAESGVLTYKQVGSHYNFSYKVDMLTSNAYQFPITIYVKELANPITYNITLIKKNMNKIVPKYIKITENTQENSFSFDVHSSNISKKYDDGEVNFTYDKNAIEIVSIENQESDSITLAFKIKKKDEKKVFNTQKIKVTVDGYFEDEATIVY